jgi:hypothetical protein
MRRSEDQLPGGRGFAHDILALPTTAFPSLASDAAERLKSDRTSNLCHETPHNKLAPQVNLDSSVNCGSPALLELRNYLCNLDRPSRRP